MQADRTGNIQLPRYHMSKESRGEKIRPGYLVSDIELEAGQRCSVETGPTRVKPQVQRREKNENELLM